MTPQEAKEEAIKLRDEFMPFMNPNNPAKGIYATKASNAKKCAIIAQNRVVKKNNQRIYRFEQSEVVNHATIKLLIDENNHEMLILKALEEL